MEEEDCIPNIWTGFHVVYTNIDVAMRFFGGISMREKLDSEPTEDTFQTARNGWKVAISRDRFIYFM